MSINKHAGIILFFLLLINGAVAQDNLPFTPDEKDTAPVEREMWIAPAVGFAPSVNALRLSAVSGNLLLNRAGAYYTIEKGLDSDHFRNIFGVTVTVYKYIYLWGGVDLFSTHGVFQSWKGSRKEAGVGITPWNDLVLTAGWSKSVGVTFSLGWKLPIGR